MNKRILILVEGQTEERFVKDVLAPAYFERSLFFYPTILMTKRIKDGSRFKGGVTNFSRFRDDLRRLLGSVGGGLVTTMIDYYQLPPDFPGMNSRPENGTPYQRVAHVENAILQHFGAPRFFVPFLALHEFEALLFSAVAELQRTLVHPRREKELETIRDGVASPEEINERPGCAPSKQIMKLFPAYQKTLHGPATIARIGLTKIRMECPHFNAWIAKLDAFASDT